MAELKAQLYLLEKEKKALELKVSTRDAQEQAYLVHIEHLKSEVEEQKEQRMRSLSSTSSKEKMGKVRPQLWFYLSELFRSYWVCLKLGTTRVSGVFEIEKPT